LNADTERLTRDLLQQALYVCGKAIDVPLKWLRSKKARITRAIELSLTAEVARISRTDCLTCKEVNLWLGWIRDDGDAKEDSSRAPMSRRGIPDLDSSPGSLPDLVREGRDRGPALSSLN
jgi:hypothetical protein